MSVKYGLPQSDPIDFIFTQCKYTADQFEKLLHDFNQTPENAGNTGEYGSEENQPKTIAESKKVQMLQEALKTMGFNINLTDPSGKSGPFMCYDKDLGANNRKDYLCVNGRPLKQTDYPGTILPTS